MNTEHHHHSVPMMRMNDRHSSAINRVREDIVWFESRLTAMRTSGDCAYEHALVRAYTRLLDEHRKTLHSLLSN